MSADAGPPELTSLGASAAVLSNGVRMPMLGFGLTHNEGGVDRTALDAAIAAGVRLFDTASRYGTEKVLGEAIRSSGLPRSDFFLTSKLWPGDAHNVRAAYEASCREAGVESLDLYLCHWPGMGGDAGRLAAWRGMEQLLAEGRVRAIGVSNFLQRHLEPLVQRCSVRPMVNQIEFNPFQHPAELLRYCFRQGIVVEGYCPLGKGHALDRPGVRAVADKVHKTPAQVLIRWSMQKGVVTIPKTRSASRAAENASVFDFEIPPSDVDEMDTWHCDMRVTWDPTGIP